MSSTDATRRDHDGHDRQDGHDHPASQSGWRLWLALGAGAAILTALALVFFTGSSDSDYPTQLPFPSRTDRLVLKSPEQLPTRLNEPGRLDADLAALDQIGGRTVDPSTLPADLRSALDRYLKATFATPSAPTFPTSPELSAAAARLGLENSVLVTGGKLFRKHCQQCHGLAGDGRGPTGLWINPYPRDFRRGMFKFVSTGASGLPRPEDLLRTITEGLKGTAMPAFGLLPDAEREALVRYVIFLTLRGQTEFHTLAAIAAADAGATGDPAQYAASRLKQAANEWQAALASAATLSEPSDGEPGSETHAAAVRRGYQLFTSNEKDSCISCHGDFGRKPQLRYDVWGTVAKPADFTAPELKGGTRPVDVYHRIRGGIPAVGMPAHPKFTDRQVWDLVRFVRAVPFPRELPPDVRVSVYPVP